jgi:Tfp pilus assembly protein PilV
MNERGQSLVQVIVATGIMAILMLALTSFQTYQFRENKALAETLASLDFTRVVTSLLANPSSCNALLASANVIGGASSLTFDATNVTVAAPYEIDLVQIADVNGGGTASPTSNSLTISPTKGIQLSVTSPTTGNIIVSFDQKKLVRQKKDLLFPVSLQSTGTLSNTTITGCGGSSYQCPPGQAVIGISNGGTQCASLGKLLQPSDIKQVNAYANSSCDLECTKLKSACISAFLLDGSLYNKGASVLRGQTQCSTIGTNWNGGYYGSCICLKNY